MPAFLWVPLAIALAWLAFVRSAGRHVQAVRVVGGVVAGAVMLVSLMGVIPGLAEPVGEYSLLPLVAAITAGCACGLAGIARWYGRSALILRWVGMVFVMVVPTVFFDAGILGVAAGLLYAPVLQMARPQTALDDE